MIDANCYYGHWPNQSPRLVCEEDLKPLRSLGIKRFCLCATTSLFRNAQAGNEEVIEFAERTSGVIPVAVIGDDPQAADDVEQLIDRGVRLFRGPARPVARPSAFAKSVERISDAACGLILQYGYDPFTPYDLSWHQWIRAVAKDHPRLHVILVGLNYPQMAGILDLIESYENTYLEISHFQVCDGIRLLCDSVGAGRLVFGTDCPRFAPECAVLKLDRADIDTASRQAIAAENLYAILEG